MSHLEPLLPCSPLYILLTSSYGTMSQLHPKLCSRCIQTPGTKVQVRVQGWMVHTGMIIHWMLRLHMLLLHTLLLVVRRYGWLWGAEMESHMLGHDLGMTVGVAAAVVTVDQVLESWWSR